MLFNSLEFGLFFTLVFGLYLCLPLRGQNRMLLLASYVFYAAWDWRFCSLLAVSTIVDFSVGRSLHASKTPRRRKLLVTLSLVTNLGILGFFKYADFFADNLQELAGVFGFTLPEFTLSVVLPVGISFYTFQTLSYTIDVYRGRLEPTRRFWDFALFVAFFPQLVAGPIERARHLLPQILEKRQLSMERVSSGAWLALWGLFKKVVIADNLAAVVDAVFHARADPTAAEIVVAAWAFAYQIYCDFSGYTDIARGVARMLGFELMLNFDLPYTALNPADFWRRWHISLSTWLRDYLYIPLGGNRGGPRQTYRNLFLTMLIGGLWHGAAWPMACWGAYHGVLLIAHRAARPWLERIWPAGSLTIPYNGVRRFVTFQLVCVGWLMFRSEDLSQMLGILGRLGGPHELGQAGQWLLPLILLTAPLFLMQFFQLRQNDLEPVKSWPLPARLLTYATVMILIILTGDQLGQPFVYFQF